MIAALLPIFAPQSNERIHAQILILGAGRSASSLIQYLIQHAEEGEWRITVADQNAAMLKDGSKGPRWPQEWRWMLRMPKDRSVDRKARSGDQHAARLHAHGCDEGLPAAEETRDHAELCTRCPVAHGYGIQGRRADRDERDWGWIPGIDHMSAMRILDRIRRRRRTDGGLRKLLRRSWWHRRATTIRGATNSAGTHATWCWPAKAVQPSTSEMASRSTSPTTSSSNRRVRVEVPGSGAFDGYANRDSLKYRAHYGMEEIPTLVRGTLRKAGLLRGLGCIRATGLHRRRLRDGTRPRRHVDGLPGWLSFHRVNALDPARIWRSYLGPSLLPEVMAEARLAWACSVSSRSAWPAFHRPPPCSTCWNGSGSWDQTTRTWW